MVPLTRKVISILDFPEPQDETELKRFLGLCAQFGKFFPNLSHMGKPLRELLKKDNIFHFGPVEKQHFNDIKQAIGTQMSLITYDPELKTRIYHDACKTGLAYVVMQNMWMMNAGAKRKRTNVSVNGASSGAAQGH